MFLPLLLAQSLLHTLEQQNSDGSDGPDSGRCDFTHSSVPAGSCAGPLERAQKRRMASALAITNAGCAINQIPFRPDSSTTVTKCGQCDPQQTLPSGYNPNCPISHICSDAGLCLQANKYALFGQECPGGGASLWCGSLVCINRRCVQCIDGTVIGGYTCIKGQYYGDYLAKMRADASTITAFCAIAITTTVILLCSIIGIVQCIVLKKKFKRVINQKILGTGTPIYYPTLQYPGTTGDCCTTSVLAKE